MTEAELDGPLLSTPEDLLEQQEIVAMGLESDAAEMLVFYHGREVTRRARWILANYRNMAKTREERWLFLSGIALGLKEGAKGKG